MALYLASGALIPIDDRLSRTFYVMASAFGIAFFAKPAVKGPSRIAAIATIGVLVIGVIYMTLRDLHTLPLGLVIFPAMFFLPNLMRRWTKH
jgi:hypothetical protein